jgi:hypothetical protein
VDNEDSIYKEVVILCKGQRKPIGLWIKCAGFIKNLRPDSPFVYVGAQIWLTTGLHRDFGRRNYPTPSSGDTELQSYGGNS